MYCITCTVGESVTDEIHIQMVEGSDVPAIYIGKEKDEEVYLPVSHELFSTMIDLDRKTLELAADSARSSDSRDKKFAAAVKAGMSLPSLTNVELQPGSEDGEVAGRPGDEKDRRALVLVRPPTDDPKVRYSGSYKQETYNGKEVKRAYPTISNVTGIELLAEVDGTMLLIMEPGACFRVGRKRGTDPSYHMYRLSTGGSKPRLWPLKDKPKDKAA